MHNGLHGGFLLTMAPGKPAGKIWDFSVKTFSSYKSLCITPHKEVYD